MKGMPCDYCGKPTYVKEGWHLKAGKIYLSFCSNKCVANYIEKTMVLLFKKLNNQEKRIKKLEKKLKK